MQLETLFNYFTVKLSYFAIVKFTLLEGVCIRLTWHLHNHDMTYVMNMKEGFCMFLKTVIKCLSLNNDILNANMTLFEMSLLW